jgi:hypothetical protein
MASKRRRPIKSTATLIGERWPFPHAPKSKPDLSGERWPFPLSQKSRPDPLKTVPSSNRGRDGITREPKPGEAKNAPLPVACGCRGGNPNCFRCGGWGYLDSIGKARASPGSDGAAFSTPRAKRRKRCPNCGAMVGRLGKHLKKCARRGGIPKLRRQL